MFTNAPLIIALFPLFITLLLVWLFFRYFIRLVKSNESIADSLEEISAALRNKQNSPAEKE
mgnify:CR=1 FL=1